MRAVANILPRARIEQERLEKNKERRKKREKQKKLQQKMRDGGAGGVDEGSPEPTTEKVTGTTRKCANCGQVGHIKTNKKYVCPCSQQQDTAAPRAAEDGERQESRRSKKSSKRVDRWKPTVDPRCWEADAFKPKMGEAAPPPNYEQPTSRPVARDQRP